MVEFRKGQKSKLSDLTAGTDLYVGVQLDSPGLTFDIACFGLDASERLSDDRYFIFFNQPKSPEESIQLLGAQAGDTESFRVTLDRVPASVNKLAFTATVDGDGVMSQVASGYLRIVAGGQEVARYSFTGREFSTERAVMIADLYKKDVWRFSAVGQGFDGGLRALLENFGGEVAEDEPEPAPKPVPVPPGGAPGFAPPSGGPPQHQPAPSFGPPGGGPPPAPQPVGTMPIAGGPPQPPLGGPPPQYQQGPGTPAHGAPGGYPPPPGPPQPPYQQGPGTPPHGAPGGYPPPPGPPQYQQGPGTPPHGAPGGYPPPPGPPQPPYQQGPGTPPHGAPGGYPPPPGPPGPGGYPNQMPHQGHMAPPAPPGTGQPGGYPAPGPPGPGGYPGPGQPGQMQPTLQMPVPGGPMPPGPMHGGPMPPGPVQGGPPGPPPGVGLATPEPAFQYGIEQYREVPAGGRWAQQNPKMVRVDVSGGKVIARQGVMVAYQGDVKFKFQGQSLRSRFDNRQTGQSLELMRCEGNGEVFLAEDAANLHLVELQGNKLFVNVANVLAFDEGLTIEPARVEGAGIPGGALFAQTFSGQGTVVVKTKGIPLVLPVQGPTFADSNAIVAWTDMDVSTTTQMRLRRTAFPGHSGETVNLQFRCPPGTNNFIVVQPYEV
ncbi:TerD family protein [Embleya sp. AB8]|uniref:TerD family protein n=1 Tax=Embleya sp. AB8 TaxID=3156304 RepID=UPI003C70BC81